VIQSDVGAWAVYALAALLVLGLSQRAGLSPIATTMVLVFVGLTMAMVIVRPAALASAALALRRSMVSVVIAAFCVPSASQVVGHWTDSGSVLMLASLAVAAVAGIAILAPSVGRLPRPVLPTLSVIVVGLLTLLSLPQLSYHIDVFEFMTRGSEGLLNGRNPYAMTYPNVYDAQESAVFYGPGVLVNDEVTYGFPYLPASLFGAVPGFLLGDVRLSNGLALLLLALAVLWDGHADLRSRVIAIALVIGPGFFLVAAGSFTEPMQVAILGAAALAMKRRRMLVAAILVGLLLATKQYLIVALPCLWLLRSIWRPRHYAIAIGTGAAVMLPFVVNNFGAFWRSVFEFHMVQRFRGESLSWLALSVNQFGWPRPSLFGVLPIAVGVVVSVGLASYYAPGPAAFVVATAASTLAMVMTSKQAFPNYYCFVGGALLIAAVIVTSRDPRPRRTARPFRRELLSREVTEVGDVRREAGVHA
jgi:hypothetical protein